MNSLHHHLRITHKNNMIHLYLNCSFQNYFQCKCICLYEEIMSNNPSCSRHDKSSVTISITPLSIFCSSLVIKFNIDITFHSPYTRWLPQRLLLASVVIVTIKMKGLCCKAVFPIMKCLQAQLTHAVLLIIPYSIIHIIPRHP